MVDVSIKERLRMLASIILPSSFFKSLIVVFILTAIILIVNVKVRSKVLKILSAICYMGIISYIFVKYGSSVLDLSDNLVDKVFNAIYFPNIITYGCIIIITFLLFLRSMIDKDCLKFVKIVSIFAFLIIIFLFVLTIDTSIKLGVDITNKQAIYTNESLVVSIQSSTFVFAIWSVILIINEVASSIFRKKVEVSNVMVVEDNVSLGSDELSKIKTKIDELNLEQTIEVSQISQEDFQETFKKYKQEQKLNKLKEIFKTKE